jgi:hypothetical protein
MRRNLAIETSVPESSEDKPGEVVNHVAPTLIARLVSIREKIEEAKGEANSGDLDRLAAPWFDAAVSKHPKADSLAAEIGVSAPYLSAMRHGDKPTPIRTLLAFLENKECAYEFACQFLTAAGLPTPPREHATLTRADVLETALAMLVEGPLLKSLIRECGEKFGAQPGDVLRALSSK